MFSSNLYRAERHINEEVLEKRIEILTKSVRKSQRRQRVSALEIFDDSKDEYVSSVLYHREQMRVKVKIKVIIMVGSCYRVKHKTVPERFHTGESCKKERGHC